MKKKSQSGMIAVYIALLVAMIITTGAIAMGGILSRQIRSAADIVGNEQAFYLADSGGEAVLYDLKNKVQSIDTSLSEVSGTIDYQDFTGTFAARGKLSITADLTRTLACVQSEGKSRGQERRVAIGSNDCDLQ